MNSNNQKKLKHLVSIIMPAYNCEEFIEETINSVQNQSYGNWELIVVDDASTDKTGEIIKEISMNDNRVIYIKFSENKGAALARNKAIEVASGEYLAFLDSDDLWLPEKLSKQISFMEKNDFYFTCTTYGKIDEKSNNLEKSYIPTTEAGYEDILRNCPGNSTVIYNAKKLGKFFIPNIKKRNDFVMWLQVIKKAEQLYGIHELLSFHRVREGSLSVNKASLIEYQWKVYRDIEKLSIAKSGYLVVYKVIQSIIKK